jgi:hypothetical protein
MSVCLTSLCMYIWGQCMLEKCSRVRSVLDDILLQPCHVRVCTVTRADPVVCPALLLLQSFAICDLATPCSNTGCGFNHNDLLFQSRETNRHAETDPRRPGCSNAAFTIEIWKDVVLAEGPGSNRIYGMRVCGVSVSPFSLWRSGSGEWAATS